MRRRHRKSRPLPAAPFECEVVDLDHEGRGVARMQGKVVFVADALPGETVLARYTRIGRDADEAQTIEVRQASPHRVEPRCTHFGYCGGCALQHLEPQQQMLFKQRQLVQALARIGQVTAEEIAEPLAGPAWGYRRRARLGAHYMASKGIAKIGFRERRSGQLAELQGCEVLDPRVGEGLTRLGELVAATSLRARIPQIEVAATDRVAMVIRVLDPPTADDLERMRGFATEQQVDIYIQPAGPDSAEPLDPVPLPSFSPDGGSDRLHYRPTDFIQINGALSEAMVRQALDWLRPTAGDTVLELFSGLGTFTAPLAATGAQVTAVEGEAGLVARGRANTEALGYAVDWQVANLFESTADADWAGRDYALALIDPPRAGAIEVLPMLARSGARRLVYVSCHPATLARDAGVLVRDHGFRLRRAGVMDMFPHTAHVESMALFER
jgi:23S rRNA (uracil1939-C5)-methyltransferase